jgi:integrase
MSIKKKSFSDDEITIFDEAIVYKRGEYWQMRMWLAKEQKYARFSLKTRNRDTAVDKAKKHYHELMAMQLAGRTYFSKTCKDGVEEYLKQRWLDVKAGLIVEGRFGTIRTHLEHWLNFIGRDTKLKELEQTDCENYYHSRSKTRKNITVSQTTIANEQSTINAMLAWLFKRNETYIYKFDFKQLKRVDRGAEENRRSTFTDAEANSLVKVIDGYIKEAELDLENDSNLKTAIAGYYMGVALISGLRRGEQLQLTWADIDEIGTEGTRNAPFDIVKIRVRQETSKVRKTRHFAIRDTRYFVGLHKLARRRHKNLATYKELEQATKKELIFSTDGMTPISTRTIGYHFYKLLELAGIQNDEERDLVPYSFRHYFITQRVNSNIPVSAIAEMCGTSIVQIERTYYHTSVEKMVSNALRSYTVKDGLIILD